METKVEEDFGLLIYYGVHSLLILRASRCAFSKYSCFEGCLLVLIFYYFSLGLAAIQTFCQRILHKKISSLPIFCNLDSIHSFLIKIFAKHFLYLFLDCPKELSKYSNNSRIHTLTIFDFVLNNQ